ncbi:superinfection immunity protein [Halomonas elongata]|uniref:superinfection immunity protein n=1 Tax=Halomonas elongata TaxID=2746 RepID=UPI00255ADF59|nr:superinfection immunity protein [Halomonas elongata]MDL4862002.1 superinfection immunity protein [Halomonas elongata]
MQEHTFEVLARFPLHPLIALFLLVVVYCLPLIIAAIRNHENAVAIAVLNIVAGWTFVGWVVALTWSCLANKGVSSGSNQ